MKMTLSVFDVVSKDFTLNVLLVRISVLWECFIFKMLDHIALLRAIKKKKKTLPDRPTDPPCKKKKKVKGMMLEVCVIMPH